MSEDVIRTHREINGRDPKPGYEWDAGQWPMTAGRLGGRVTVRLTQSGWQIVQVTFLLDHTKREHPVDPPFPPGDDGERAAKTRARQIYAERRLGKVE